MSERDAEWATQMRAGLSGDGAAYHAVLASLTLFLRGEVRRGFSRYGNGGADVEDVVQETLIAIHLKRETWRPQDPLIPWVRAIARNKLIDSLRRGGRRVNVPIEDFEDVLAAPEPTQHLTERDAGEILDQLKGRQRDIVEAISIHGVSIRETASKFDISEGAVRVALHRGLATLAKAYRTNES